jgi:DNA (cytosine-5)-methyltransferase 3A
MRPLRVLSLFDGISCGQVALERAEIPVEVYYASEIDKYAIQITQKNYPNTIQLGDINNIDFTQYIGKIDLIMGGSPCQDLSIAGKRAGLQGERSGLFYKFVEALQVIKPKYFLLENNVGMPQEAYEEISKLMGCYPIMINSALVSAQTRKRYYWTSIGSRQYNLFGFPTVDIPQPDNKGILLKDVLESGIPYQKKADCLTTRYQGATFPHDYFRNQRTQIAEPIKIPENTIKGYAEINQGECMDLTHINSKTRRGRAMKDKCNCLQTSSEFYQYLEPIRLPEYEKSKGQANRVYSVRSKSVTLLANAGGGGAKTGLYKIDLPDGEYLIRKLTPLECERLQTLPDNYTEGVSNTQRYKAIGNGWTVDVIAHIFKHIKD